MVAYDRPQTVANWVTNEVLRELKDNTIEQLAFGGAQLGELVALIDANTISATIGKEVFAEMLKTGDAPKTIVAKRGLEQITDVAAVTPIVEQVIAANGDKAEQYRSGKTGLLGFFMGQVMKETNSKANPQLVRELLQEKLA